jgi:hypothetical protein
VTFCANYNERKFLDKIVRALVLATHVPGDQISLSISEVPSSWAMEMGQIVLATAAQ